jgi:hypothetical protein
MLGKIYGLYLTTTHRLVILKLVKNQNHIQNEQVFSIKDSLFTVIKYTEWKIRI